MIKIVCKNNNQSLEYQYGTSLQEIKEDLQPKTKYPVLGALVNNKIHELNFIVMRPSVIEFIDISHKEGMRMYFRSLYFVLMKAVKDLIPGADPRIEHSISNGYFCEIKGVNLAERKELTEEIKKRMQELIDADIPFVKETILNQEAVAVFEKQQLAEKAHLFKQSPSLYTVVYHFDNMTDYLYGSPVPSSGYLQNFDLQQLYKGLLLRVPREDKPEELRPFVRQDKMFDIMKEHKQWVKILKVPNVGRLNDIILAKNQGELIKISEALHEKKIAKIADRIQNRKDTRLILIAGPSSSGKTTFSKRLAIQLKVAGLHPVMISLDNYFVNRELTPVDENGEYDFESIDAIDIPLFVQDMNRLFQGNEVELPTFDFTSGKRTYEGKSLKIKKNTLIIVEGIHALNPKMSQEIASNLKYKIYVSALTQVGIDGHNRIPTTDNRLLRRIIRDYKYRGYSAYETLKRWSSVRKGEEKYIFPFQEEADIMFNSSLVYELAMIKKHVEPLLLEIKQEEPEFAEASRLLRFLSYFKHINSESEVPPTSILREFLGKSSFHY